MIKINNDIIDLFKQALELWGKYAQLRILSEECSECSAEVNKYYRGRSKDQKLASEVADVIIMGLQAREILGDVVDKEIEFKISRLKERIEKLNC